MTRPTLLLKPSSLEPQKRDGMETFWVLALSALKGLALLIVAPVTLIAFVLNNVFRNIFRAMDALYKVIHSYQPAIPGPFRTDRSNR